MELTDSQIKELGIDLSNLRLKLQEDLELAEEGSQPVTLDQQAVGRVSRIDAIQQQQMHAASVDRIRSRLKLIDSALQRLEANSYGLCMKCEESIPFKRLKVRPESLNCVDCA